MRFFVVILQKAITKKKKKSCCIALRLLKPHFLWICVCVPIHGLFFTPTSPFCLCFLPCDISSANLLLLSWQEASCAVAHPHRYLRYPTDRCMLCWKPWQTKDPWSLPWLFLLLRSLLLEASLYSAIGFSKTPVGLNYLWISCLCQTLFAGGNSFKSYGEQVGRVWLHRPFFLEEQLKNK